MEGNLTCVGEGGEAHRALILHFKINDFQKDVLDLSGTKRYAIEI
jgi:hypothetical protein